MLSCWLSLSCEMEKAALCCSLEMLKGNVTRGYVRQNQRSDCCSYKCRRQCCVCSKTAVVYPGLLLLLLPQEVSQGWACGLQLHVWLHCCPAFCSVGEHRAALINRTAAAVAAMGWQSWFWACVRISPQLLAPWVLLNTAYGNASPVNC